jgi:uncharacterized protein YgiM (DUF1202 family)
MASRAVSLLIALFALVAWTEAAPGAVTATVQGAQALNIRQGPGTEHAVAGNLALGAEVTVEAVEGDWARVRTAGGTTGYVHRTFLRLAAGRTWSDAGSAGTSPTPTPTTTPAAEPETPAVTGQAVGDEQAATATPAAETPLECAAVQARLDRLLRIAEATHAEVTGRMPAGSLEQSSVDFGKSPGAGPILAIAFAGALFGFMIGTLYGRRQERNKRNRVRL